MKLIQTGVNIDKCIQDAYNQLRINDKQLRINDKQLRI